MPRIAVSLLLLVFTVIPTRALAVSLQDVEQNLASITTLRGRYQQVRHIKGLAAPLKSSGRLFFDRATGLVWIQEEPFKTSYAFTKERMVISVDKQNKKVIKKDESSDSFRFNELVSTAFAGDHRLILEYFDLQFQDLGEASWKIYLVPKKSVFRRMLRSIQLKGKRHLENVAIFESNGNRTDLDFFGIQTDAGLLSNEENRYFQD